MRYLADTIDKGVTIQSTGKLEIDCYAYASIVELWGVGHGQDHISVNSRTIFVIIFMRYFLLCTSKLQTIIALSTMEAEYIVFSTSIRKLAATRGILQEIGYIIRNNITALTLTAFEIVFKLSQSQIFEDNQSCQKISMITKIHPRTKQITIHYHFFRTKVADFDIKVVSIGTYV